jgi:beta-lactamase superfamily II metal-dependent hydrolase
MQGLATLSRRRALALGALAALIAVNGVVWREALAPARLVVRVLEPGAVLVRSPSGRTLLYGAGPDASILRALGSALPYGARRIDVVVEAAPAGAQAGGLPSVLARYRVGMLISAGEQGSAALSAAESAARISPTIAARGMRLELGGALAEVLFPDRDVSGASSAEQVAVLELRSGTATILLDDAPSALEPYLAQINESEPAAGLVVSTSTPAGVWRF